jgi:hypothetical protein
MRSGHLSGGFSDRLPGGIYSDCQRCKSREVGRWSVLVLEVFPSFITLRALYLPWHTALDHANFRLGGGRCGLAAWKIVN